MAERIFYATHNVTFGGAAVKGVQSVSLSSNFNLEPIFQLGQASQIAFSQGIPEVEITITRALVGGCLYPLTLTDSNIEAAEAVLNDAKTLTIGTVAGGFQVSNAVFSGYTANFTTDGVFTEELSFVGDTLSAGGSFSPFSDANVVVPQRQDFSGIDNATTATVSVNLSRDASFRLGQYRPFGRFVNFPVECTISYGLLLPTAAATPGDPPSCASSPQEEETISISACDASWSIQKARLTNVEYSGGDTGGGNVEVTYTYTSFTNFIMG
jgi:hypothetical protein